MVDLAFFLQKKVLRLHDIKLDSLKTSAPCNNITEFNNN